MQINFLDELFQEGEYTLKNYREGEIYYLDSPIVEILTEDSNGQIYAFMEPVEILRKFSNNMFVCFLKMQKEIVYIGKEDLEPETIINWSEEIWNL